MPEKASKKRVTVNIAGVSLAILTDEDSDSVKKIASSLDSQIMSLRGPSGSVSVLDAALLCSIENISGKQEAESKVRSLEAQIALCEVNIKSMRDEISELKDKIEEMKFSASQPSAEIGSGSEDSVRGEGIISKLGLSDSSPTEKISALEKYLDAKKQRDGGNPPTRKEKIRYIESLLKGSLSDDE